MIFQAFRKNTLWAYFKYEAHFDKKMNASKLKESDYVYVQKPKADHQGRKLTFTDFRWTGPCIGEKVSPNNIFSVRKVGTDKTQVFYRMRPRRSTRRPPILGVQITPKGWKPDHEVIIKHDDLYARAKDCENEKSMFYDDRDNSTISTSPKIIVPSDATKNETSTIRGVIPECRPEIFSQAE